MTIVFLCCTSTRAHYPVAQKLCAVTSITQCSAHSQGDHLQSSREVLIVELGSLYREEEGGRGDAEGGWSEEIHRDEEKKGEKCTQ